MKETLYLRTGKTIKDISSGKPTTYKSINQAKKESCKLQIDLDGGLGRGSVAVVKVKPPTPKRYKKEVTKSKPLHQPGLAFKKRRRNTK